MNNEQPQRGLVTVVMATYNMARYLPQAVASVLAQTYPAVEVQIVDDGSTDNTPEVTEQLQKDPRVRAYRQPNGGQAKAKNQGVLRARGEYVAFLDADDAWLPNKLELQIPLLERDPDVGVVYSSIEYMDGNGVRNGRPEARLYRGAVSGQLLLENFVPFPTSVVRRRCLDEVGLFDETFGMGIDYDLWLRMSARYRFDYVAEPTALYRVWEGQMSKNYRRRYEAGIAIMQRFLEQHPGVIPDRLVRRAWAHTYVGRGNTMLWQEGRMSEAFRDYLRGLRHDPSYFHAWRSILRALVTHRAPK